MSDYMRRLRGKIGTDLVQLPSVTVLARDGGERVLLVRHSETGTWVLPGGTVEPHEVPADAAVREMWEETGLHVELPRVLGVYGGPEFHVTYGNGDEISFVVIVFEGRPVSGEARADGEEILEVRWVTPAEAARLPMPAWARLVLADALRGRSRTHFRAPAWVPPGTSGAAAAGDRP
jgi:8-oxo-dGTP pyrophosphatase MutT (NUDIX family)